MRAGGADWAACRESVANGGSGRLLGSRSARDGRRLMATHLARDERAREA
jgi:hypothetical protein